MPVARSTSRPSSASRKIVHWVLLAVSRGLHRPGRDHQQRVTSGGPEEPARDEARASRFGGRAGLVVTVAVGAVLAVGAFLLAREQATEPPRLLGVGARRRRRSR